MRIPRIYCRQKIVSGTSMELDSDAAHHVAKVLRMGDGRPLILFDGSGSEFEAQILESTRRQVWVKVGKAREVIRESPLHIELAIGISRGERMEWVIQKATELGVSSIQPLLSERTEVKLTAERFEKKQKQWQKIVQSACEQCQRNRLAEIKPIVSLIEFIKNCDAEKKLLMHYHSEGHIAHSNKPKSVALLIGPEGGLSEAEIESASQYQFKSWRLGPRVMRTETAPIAALSVLQYLWGDFV